MMAFPEEFRVRLLSPQTLYSAEKFATALLTSTTFTHFRHTRPLDMLRDADWHVYLLVTSRAQYEQVFGRSLFITDSYVVGWMQVFNPGAPSVKEHIARIGFALLEEFRGRHLGSEMVDYILGEWRPKVAKFEATVYADNFPMLEIYFKRDFHVEGCFVDAERWNNKSRNVLSLARFTR